MTKQCTSCRLDLPEDNFWVRRLKNSTALQDMCKKCSTERRALYYKKNKQKEVDRINKRTAEIKQWFDDYRKSCVCSECGEDRHYVLDFHHISEKTEAVSVLVSNRYGIKRIKQEIDKCVVLCANCHREFHYFEKINGLVS